MELSAGCFKTCIKAVQHSQPGKAFGYDRLDIVIEQSHAREVGAWDRCPLAAEMDTSQQVVVVSRSSKLSRSRYDGELSVSVRGHMVDSLNS
jgi:hypothetical protein